MNAAREQSAVLYLGRVMHRRYRPLRHRFRYRVYALLADIDRLADLDRPRWLSRNRFNLLSFHDRDHGPRDGSALRPWIERTLAKRAIDLEGGRVRLLCFPRVLGYAFKPISLWYCEHRDGSLRAVLCEVNNTFGERHGYLLHDAGRPLHWPLRSEAHKCFHVSPLIGMHGEYRFRIAEPAAELGMTIRELQDGQPLMVASMQAARRRLDDRSLLLAFVAVPLMSFKVIAAIHWQALLIWLKGAPFYRKPQPPLEEVS